jgi:hypothetical protein
MMVFPIRIKHTLNVAVQRSHDADAREHRGRYLVTLNCGGRP